MTTTKVSKIFESVLNNDIETADKLFHSYILEKARTINESMLAADEQLHEKALDGDIEADLASDIATLDTDETAEDSVDHEFETAEASDDLATDMVDDEASDEEVSLDADMTNDSEETPSLETLADTVDDLQDSVLDIEAEFAKIQQAFKAETQKDETMESVELTKVAAPKKPTEGAGAKSPYANVKREDFGGTPFEMGVSGEAPKNFEKQEPTTKAKVVTGLVNKVSSSADVLKPVKK